MAQTLRDELDTKLFLLVSPGKARFYQDPLHGWAVVISQFPSALFDIEEAAKCFALNRYTGAVFHLSRVAEIAAVTIGRRVGYDSPREGFGEVLNYLDNGLRQVRESYQSANPRFKGDVEFLSVVSALGHSVNQAWRQRVSHMDRQYTEEEATRIWAATQGLMQQLATKLSETYEMEGK